MRVHGEAAGCLMSCVLSAFEWSCFAESGMARRRGAVVVSLICEWVQPVAAHFQFLKNKWIFPVHAAARIIFAMPCITHRSTW